MCITIDVFYFYHDIFWYYFPTPYSIMLIIITSAHSSLSLHLHHYHFTQLLPYIHKYHQNKIITLYRSVALVMGWLA